MTLTSKTVGIELSATCARIGQLRGGEVHVFRNAEGAEYTPAAVYFNKANSLVVGREARVRYESDPHNAAIEFMRDMGSDTEFHFACSGRRMRAEDLSAEVLKSLCGDVQRSTGEIVTAAVITVPADFDLPQNKATEHAAQLAGIKHAMLMTEPAAAAQAYSFGSRDDKTFWLVYDFGGGTFDTSIIQVRDGLIQVVGHGGDNQLGGKNIDWAIVEQLFIPKLLKAHALTDFKRGNPRWRGAMAKLKLAAEEAKIRLSSPTSASTEIAICCLCNDDGGGPIEFEFELKRSDFEFVAAPIYRRTINCCRDVIARHRLAPGDFGKLILVGEHSTTPFLRQMLADPKEGLGIALEFSVDPETVVVRGAAIFAASQHLVPGDESTVNPAVGQFAVGDPAPSYKHSIGLALSNNEVASFYERGTPLPFRKCRSYHTPFTLRAGESGAALRFHFVEGEKSRANRNRCVGQLRIPAERIACDIPAGSEIEIALSIDTSMQLSLKVYVPILDDEFEEVMQLVCTTPSAKDLLVEFLTTKERLKDLRQKADATAGLEALAVLQRIDSECLVSEIESLVGPASSQTDAARQCSDVLQRLQSSLDDVENALERPALLPRTAELSTYRLLLTRPGKAGGTECSVTGRILAPPPGSTGGLTLEFINVDAKPEWKSGIVSLNSTGAFSLDVGIDPAGTTNEFHVTLRDSGGNRLRLTPDYFVLRTQAEM